MRSHTPLERRPEDRTLLVVERTTRKDVEIKSMGGKRLGQELLQAIGEQRGRTEAGHLLHPDPDGEALHREAQKPASCPPPISSAVLELYPRGDSFRPSDLSLWDFIPPWTDG